MINQNLKIIILYVLVCLIWGSTWLAIRLGLNSLTPFMAAGFRFAMASIFIFAAMRFQGLTIQKDKVSVRLYMLMGFFSFVIPFGLVYWGQQFVPSGLASVLFGVYPFFVALFSFFAIPEEDIGVFKLTGMILGFAGILVIFSDDLDFNFSSYFLGMIAIVLSAVMQATIAVSVKKYGHHLNPLSMNLIPMAIAGAVFLLFGVMVEDISKLKFDEYAVLSVLYLALFGSLVTFTSYYWLLKRVNIVILSLIAFITPIIALLLGWIVLAESLTITLFAGSALVLTGLLIANLGNLRKIGTLKSIIAKPTK